jgi:hypothetical protein
MKLQIKFDIGGLSVDEAIEGASPAEITRKAKMTIASRLGFLMGAMVKSMPDLEFSREVVRRYNAAAGTRCDLPASVDAFIDWAMAQGLATPLD